MCVPLLTINKCDVIYDTMYVVCIAGYSFYSNFVVFYYVLQHCVYWKVILYCCTTLVYNAFGSAFEGVELLRFIRVAYNFQS